MGNSSAIVSPSVLGVDVGSVTISAVLMSREKNILKTGYIFHEGKIRNSLLSLLDTFNLETAAGIACTSSTPKILKDAGYYNSKTACITAVKHLCKKPGSILDVGGEKYGLIRFDKNGDYLNLKTNTSCAAGTGSFLDQQAFRLNLSNSAELNKIAMSNTGSIPKIASRCSVFAKTDIIHAQQEGYSLPEICDGLCFGLAKNITDTLFDNSKQQLPVIFTGGVSRNTSVVKYIEKIIGHPLTVHKYSCLSGAIGASLEYLEETDKQYSFSAFKKIGKPEEILIKLKEKKQYFYEPLNLKLTNYPDFTNNSNYIFTPAVVSSQCPVEVDVYSSPERDKEHPAYLGIDIGSTSTKTVIINKNGSPVAGFYTKTSGNPIAASQALFEAMADFTVKNSLKFIYKGTAATGSGRKFIGKIIGADCILNEISAHARAAYDLNPETDTIIEIGGQDSKFTAMKNGLVTYSQMNTVCAAGTGSFIEEQAAKLGVPLKEYSSRAQNVLSPITSDRCTVFMERDINNYLNNNYTVNEILAAALFSVRENYLLKVAAQGNIGNNICFQGATAKNKALVAAFEQKLKKPIHVSKYCHLTGALGAALSVLEENPEKTTFKGIGIYTEKISVRTETCGFCLNHCRISIANVLNEEVAYGFLCGRDYQTKRYIKKGSGFNLIKERDKIFSFPNSRTRVNNSDNNEQITIGLPAALHLFEDLPFWKYFFSELSIKTFSSEEYNNGVADGKRIAEAEFCAPLTALYGHVNYLKNKTDYVFLPVYLEEWKNHKNRKSEYLRKYCYYTQFSSIAALNNSDGEDAKYLRPLIGYKNNKLISKYELYKVLKNAVQDKIDYSSISRAYDNALAFFKHKNEKLKELYLDEIQKSKDISVVFLGRPYTILSPQMNKNIPEIFSSLGIKTFFQDMIPVNKDAVKEIEPLLKACHWYFASKIIETAAACTKIKNLYPVLVTSFKCTPDSFITEYFKRILDSCGKPYLILQLDEHDSNIGYETRIEAGICSFKNHHQHPQPCSRVSLPVNPVTENSLTGKTVLFPNWDPITSPLLVMNFRKSGIDARLLEEDQLKIQKSMRFNTGQCIPINIITQEFIDYIEKYNLNPENTVLWIVKSRWACGIGFYPYYIKSLLETYGNGMEKAGVFAGDITYMDLSPFITLHADFAYLFGGLLRRYGCRIRPYEIHKGETNRAIAEAQNILINAFSGRQSYISAVEQGILLFDSIKLHKTYKPKVAIFGDLYVRDNDTMNQNLIAFIEEAGGEVITTPYTEYVRIISDAAFQKMQKNHHYLELLKYKSILHAIDFLEKKYYTLFKEYFGEQMIVKKTEVEKTLSQFNIRMEHEGESYENILKIHHLLKKHPDISLFVQTNPAFCCPSLITEAMAKKIEQITGVPIVTITYDGTCNMKNDLIIPYLKYSRKKSFSTFRTV